MPKNQRRKLIDRCPAFVRVLIRWGIWLSCTALVLGFAIALFYFFLGLKFDMSKVAEMPARTLILDQDGQEMTSLHGVNRRPITYQDLPPILVYSLLAREDARFFEHPGVDPLGVLRAIRRNVMDRSFSEGASTISMQLSRNSFELREMSLHRKLLEVAVTLRIEQHYSKEEILANYLNRIYFGSGCYGVQEAALTYFGHPVNELNEGECAMLMGIIRGPHIFSPFRNFEAAIEQRDQVLDRLVAEGYLQSDDIERIQQIPIRLVPEEARVTERSYALQWVRSELEDLIDAEEIEAGGLVVKTSIDSKAQKALESRISEQLFKLESRKDWKFPGRKPGVTEGYVQCAAIQADPRSGEVKVVIGGRNPEESFYNRALFARRDLGKAFAPFVNVAASERDKLVLKGMTVQTGRQVGPGEVARISERLGISSTRRDDDLFRGAVACTPKELTEAFATMAAGGKKPELHLIREIADSKGRVLFKRQAKSKQVISSRSAESGLNFAPFVPNKESPKMRELREYSFSQRDYWVAQVQPNKEVTVLWFGFDQPKSLAPAKAMEGLVDPILD